MGPNDPFDTLARRPPRADGTPRVSPEPFSGMSMMRESTMKRLAPLAGLALGLLFGILMLVYSFTGAVLVYLFGGLGAFFGWFAYSLADGRFDVGAAWRALRRQDPDQLR